MPSTVALRTEFTAAGRGDVVTCAAIHTAITSELRQDAGGTST